MEKELKEEVKEYKFTDKKINLILMALSELPAKISIDLILDIQNQHKIKEKE